MNYTDTTEIVLLLNKLLNASEEARSHQRCLESLVFERDSCRKMMQSFRETEQSWGPTSSECDRLNAICGIIDALSDDCTESRVASLNQIKQAITSVEKKCRVAFFVQEYSLWPSLQTIYDALLESGKCTVEIVYVYTEGRIPAKRKDRNMEEYRSSGYSVVDMNDYDYCKNAPDVVFYSKPYKNANGCPSKFHVDEISKHTRYTCFCSYCLDVQGGAELYQYFYVLEAFYRYWKIFAYSKYYSSMLRRFSFRDGDNLIDMGHPKFDSLPSIADKKTYYREDWAEIIGGRPAALWNSHFSVKPNVGVGTFFRWKDVIFNRFLESDDSVLIWRPHPYFWEEVASSPEYSEQEFSKLLTALESSDNVIIDRLPDYRYSFTHSDYLISDAATFLVEYALTNRPVMYTPKPDGESVVNDAYLAHMAIGETADEIEAFIDNAGFGKNERLYNAMCEMFGSATGSNGEHIATYVYEAVYEDCEKRASNYLEPR